MHERSPTDIEVGVWDADKAFSACIEHTRSLDERQHAYLQCAVLYTTRHGQRRVRTCNLALQITSLAGNVYRFADMDAVVCHLARECECFLSYGIINLIKLHGRCFSDDEPIISADVTDTGGADRSVLIDITGVQAKLRGCHDADTGQNKWHVFLNSFSYMLQLIIPEAFRSLPVYTLAITKTKPLKGEERYLQLAPVALHIWNLQTINALQDVMFPRMYATTMCTRSSLRASVAHCSTFIPACLHSMILKRPLPCQKQRPEEWRIRPLCGTVICTWKQEGYTLLVCTVYYG